MWKCTGSCSELHASHSGSHARLARSGAPTSCGSAVRFTPRRPRPAGAVCFAHAGVDVPRGKQAPWAAAGCPTRLWSSALASLKISRHTSRSSTSCTRLGEVLPAETDDARVDDLRPDADLVHQLDARDGVVRGDVRLLDLPLVQALRTSGPCGRRCRRRRPRRRGRGLRRRRPTWPRPSTCVTWGTRSSQASPAPADVQRSCRSVMWVSASITLTSSSGSAMRRPSVRYSAGNRGRRHRGSGRASGSLPPWRG